MCSSDHQWSNLLVSANDWCDLHLLQHTSHTSKRDVNRIILMTSHNLYFNTWCEPVVCFHTTHTFNLWCELGGFYTPHTHSTNDVNWINFDIPHTHSVMWTGCLFFFFNTQHTLPTSDLNWMTFYIPCEPNTYCALDGISHTMDTNELVSWYFEPSQPQRITSTLKQTSICLLLIYFSHKSTNHKFFKKKKKNTKSILTQI